MSFIGNSPFQGMVSGGNIQDGTVGTADLVDGAITESKLGTYSVTTDKLAVGSVTAEKIADGAAVPSQLGHAGQFLTTDGTTSSWGTVDTSQGDTAYGWGDHSQVGYLTSYTETDPIYTASSWYTTTNNSSNWDTAYSWGDHSQAGYTLSSELPSFTVGGSLTNTLDDLRVQYGTAYQGTPGQGSFFFDSLNQKLMIHTGAGFVDAVPAGSGDDSGTVTDANTTFRKYTYEIGTSTNAVSGTDAEGETLAYVTDGTENVEVFVNGVKQVEGATRDYVATTGTAVTFTYNLPIGSVVDIQVYEFLSNDAYYVKSEVYTKAETNTQISTGLSSYLPLTGGTLTGSLTVNNDTFVNGAVTIRNQDYYEGGLNINRNHDALDVGAMAVKLRFGGIYNGADVYPVEVLGGVDTDGTALYYQVLVDGSSHFYTDSSQTIINDAGAARDFRVESDNNQHAIYVVGTNSAVGINTSNPADNASLSINYNTKAEISIGQWTGASGSEDGSGIFGQNLYRYYDGTTPVTKYLNSHSTIGGAGVHVGSPWNGGQLIATATPATKDATVTDMVAALEWANNRVNVNVPFGFAPLSADPSGTRAGQMYYNTTTGTYRKYDGSNWGDLTEPKIVESGLVLHWDVTNAASYPGSGTTIYDISGNGNTGTFGGNPTYSSNQEGYLVFDGVGDQINSSFTGPSGARTWAYWVNYSSLTQNNGEGYQLQGIQASGGYTYIGIVDGGNIYYYIGTGTGGNLSGSNITTNTWYYITLTFDGSSYTVYVNGEQRATGGASQGSTSATLYGGAINSNHHLYGYGSEWQFYNRGLSQSEVQQNFNAGRGRYGI